MVLIQHFDPWKGKFCTCPQKYTLNPYTGCRHGCLYCYTTSFIPQAFVVREKQNLLRIVQKELQRIQSSYLSLSNSSDPYPQEDEKKQYTRTILNMCKDQRIPVLILTKSPLVIRDIDILKEMKAVVSLTITTIDSKQAKRLEPHAPGPELRIQALKELHKAGIPTVLRLDPIIPGINDDPREWEEMIKQLHLFIRQVVVSTFKPRPDSWKRMINAFPSVAFTQSWYTQKEGNSLYLEKRKRKEILQILRETTHRYGISFSSCREGFPEWNDLHCDGSSFLQPQSMKSLSMIGGTSLRG
ncbi:MAG: radical SAM protein [Atribacterota bacterium]|nr:radical SAM protein [Atribacterota bacterium]